MQRRVGGAFDQDDLGRQSELVASGREGVGIAEAGDPRVEVLLGETQADVGPDAGRLAAGQQNRYAVVAGRAQMRLTT
jgi:hypothetical protein